MTLQNAAVAATAGNGFWVDSGPDRLFVLPAGDSQNTTTMKQGDRVAITGTVLKLPAAMKKSIDGSGGAMDEEVYVYATRIEPAT